MPQAEKVWLIERIAPDFRLMDTWLLPIEGTREDFHAVVGTITSIDPAAAGSAASRALFWIRSKLGSMLGWDDPSKRRTIPGCAEASLRDRLEHPAPATPAFRSFTPLYETDDEFAAELSNDTVHGVLHLSSVEQSPERYRAQLRVYVKARGLLGELYLKAINPFRHVIVYPSIVRSFGKAWEQRR